MVASSLESKSEGRQRERGSPKTKTAEKGERKGWTERRAKRERWRKSQIRKRGIGRERRKSGESMIIRVLA